MSISCELYIHELDKKAFDALNKFPKFVQLYESYSKNFDEKASKIQFLSSAIRLSENQMPEIYNLLPPICRKLGIKIPELYYVKSKEMNAATGGTSNPYIFITSELVEKLPIELMPTVLAHECGHIACKHYLYHSLAMQFVDGIENSPLCSIPAIRRLLTPTLVNALLFWDRCSELSADRAAVLYDENSDDTIDVLLKLNGYENINREEFIKQAMDLKSFVKDSKSNKMIESLLTQSETHPRLATRAYECYDWVHSKQYKDILEGKYTLQEKEKEEKNRTEEQEIVAAEVDVETTNISSDGVSVDDINRELLRVNTKLEKYTSEADKADYAFAVFSGLITGALDAFIIGETKITREDIGLSHKQVNNFIQSYAKSRGFDEPRLKDAIGALEREFKVLQDNSWSGAGIGISAKNHHLADIAHHPTPLGLAAAIAVKFLRIGTFVSRDGEYHFIPVKTDVEDILEILIPAVISGVLNWFVTLANANLEENGEEVPDGMKYLLRLFASLPMLVEIAECADNWFGHLVSDMGGSKNTAGQGMGIPGIFISFLYEIAALPMFKNSGLLNAVDALYQNGRVDLRHEIAYLEAAKYQKIPVIFNEVYVRLGYFLSRFGEELGNNGITGINWNRVIPFGNRTVERMITVASMTFTIADTADAAIHAAIESGGNWVLFSGKFVTRFNYVGAGRAALAIVKEVSSDQKETQLIHEKMILTEAKTEIFLEELQAFKNQLEAKVSEYLAEDISEFMKGFDYINQGLESGDTDTIIKGNVVIQRVLGREPQFTNQEEFDELIKSDIPLQL